MVASCFQLKAHFFPCTVLQVTSADWNALERQIVDTIKQAPRFFTDLPVVIDLDKIRAVSEINFTRLKEILTANKMVPVGVRGGSQEQQTAAAASGLQAIPAGKPITVEAKEKKPENANCATRLVTTPVRSGMQIYAKDSDLIVTAPVSIGAELLADGNIHVYGSLRGRALAGVQGNMQARIFCSTLDAELVSIAGYYLTKEDMQPFAKDSRMKQIYLENEQIHIAGL